MRRLSAVIVVVSTTLTLVPLAVTTVEAQTTRFIPAPVAVNTSVVAPGKVRVSWQHGSGVADSFTVLSEPRGYSCQTVSTSCDVNELDPKVAYRFVVQANSISAPGEFSNPSPYTTPAPHNFADVQPNSWANDPVRWMKANGVTTGAGGGAKYDPSGRVTRGQMAAFLWRMAGFPSSPTSCGLVDENRIPGYARAGACWLKANNITVSNPYKPDDPVTRAQMVTFLWRMYDSPPMDAENPFIDIDPTKYYGTATLWASQRQITTSETTFKPNEPVTRAQMAGFLFRAANFNEVNKPRQDIVVYDTAEIISSPDTAPEQPGEFSIDGTPPAVGDNLVTLLSDDRPYYGRVVAQSGGTVTTEPVTLRDLFPVLDLRISANPSTGALQSASPNVTIETSDSVFSQSGQSGLAEAPCSNSTEKIVAADYRADFFNLEVTGSWSWFSVESVRVTVNPEFAITAQVGFEESASCEFSKELFRKALPNITFWVGPVPVVITHTVHAEVEGVLSVTGSASLEVGATAGMRLGVEYKNGNFQPIVETHMDRQMETNVNVVAAARVGIPVYYNPQAYGFVGLDIGIAGEAELAINPLQQPYLTLDGVLSGRLAFTVLGEQYAPQRTEFYRKRLWQLNSPSDNPQTGKPTAPSLRSISAKDKQLSIFFTPSTAHDNTPVTTYEYSTDGGVTWKGRESGSTSSPLNITTVSSGPNKLQNDVTYTVKLRAVNVNGVSSASGVLAGTPKEGPPPLPPAGGPVTLNAANFTPEMTGANLAVTTWSFTTNADGMELLVIDMSGEVCDPDDPFSIEYLWETDDEDQPYISQIQRCNESWLEPARTWMNNSYPSKGEKVMFRIIPPQSELSGVLSAGRYQIVVSEEIDAGAMPQVGVTSAVPSLLPGQSAVWFIPEDLSQIPSQFTVAEGPLGDLGCGAPGVYDPNIPILYSLTSSGSGWGTSCYESSGMSFLWNELNRYDEHAGFVKISNRSPYVMEGFTLKRLSR